MRVYSEKLGQEDGGLRGRKEIPDDRIVQIW
jgi:hypothetical protein